MSSVLKKIKIGTRGSPLALAQAYSIRNSLMRVGNLSDEDFEIIPIKTSGDKLLEVKLQNFGGKGLFTKEIEQALLDGTIDIAVHSGKDVPIKRQDGLHIIATPPREDYRDAFISVKYSTINNLPEGAFVGTASVRRTAQIRAMRPDIQLVLLRGNIQTRLHKLENGICDATFLACAGLNRMNMEHIATQILDETDFLPAPAQGIIMIEASEKLPEDLYQLIKQINCPETYDRSLTERGVLEAVQGNCETPIAALSKIKGKDIHLLAEFLSPKGDIRIKQEIKGKRINHYWLGLELGYSLKEAYLKCNNQ